MTHKKLITELSYSVLKSLRDVQDARATGSPAIGKRSKDGKRSDLHRGGAPARNCKGAQLQRPHRSNSKRILDIIAWIT